MNMIAPGEAAVINIIAYLSDVIVWITLVLDIIVLISISKQIQKTLTAKFTLCLVGADLLYCLVCICFSIPKRYILASEPWQYGRLWCSVEGASLISAMAISIIAVFGVALDRWLIICRRFYFNELQGNLLVLALLVLTPSIWVVPFFLGTDDRLFTPQSSNLACLADWKSTDPYVRSLVMIAISAVAFIMIFIVFAYGQIFLLYRALILKRKQRQRPISSNSDEHSGTKQDFKFNAEQLKLLFKCLAITSSFVVLWSPYFTKIVYEAISKDDVPPVLDAFSDLSAVIYALLNPILLITLDSHTRSFVKDVFPIIFNAGVEKKQNRDPISSKPKENTFPADTIMALDMTNICANVAPQSDREGSTNLFNSHVHVDPLISNQSDHYTIDTMKSPPSLSASISGFSLASFNLTSSSHGQNSHTFSSSRISHLV